MMRNHYKVVCGFNGTAYSYHRQANAAAKAAERMRRQLDHPNCGNLASYVQVVPAGARFTRIVPADNEFGCCEVSAPRWVGD
jgi:hypothetical protein